MLMVRMLRKNRYTRPTSRSFTTLSTEQKKKQNWKSWKICPWMVLTRKDSKQTYNSSNLSRQNIIHSFFMSTSQCIRDYSLTEIFVYWPRIEWQPCFFNKWPLWTKYFQEGLTFPHHPVFDPRTLSWNPILI